MKTLLKLFKIAGKAFNLVSLFSFISEDDALPKAAGSVYCNFR